MASESTKNCRGGRKDRAVLALIEHPTMEKAAEAVGVHPTTLRRWLREPEFQEALRQARREKFSQAMGLLHLGTSAAVAQLLRIMRDPNEKGATQVRAIDCVLNRVAKAMEMEDILARLATMEQKLAELIPNTANAGDVR
jgi:transposase-like protein